ncbi:patatin [Paraglaciecola psychrophila 170]|uniref:Patatin n=1 Tax=Paraglaciecola psychrophila 170 TaxID=1129794 RepID=M4S890_9ALTE|nr:patatin [Paraglaciecola psychrophila 170]
MSALPFLCRKGVKFTPKLTAHSFNKAQAPQTDYYLDGGLAALSPVREAYRRGARKIVIICTVNADFHDRSVWLKKLKSWIYSSGYCPKTIDYLV